MKAENAVRMSDNLVGIDADRRCEVQKRRLGQL